jgi:two-component system, OmpR family, alkaline phosphatase synthesis response regulator PhoP
MTEGQKLILLAEDEENLGEGICMNLEAEGYRVMWARDGDEALDLWRENRVDLLVLDVMMPKKSGFAVCEHIRAAGDRTPVLFLTARTRAEDRIHGLEIGADDYIGKPFHLKELLLRIEGMFRRRQWYGASEGVSSVLRFGPNTIDFTRYEAVGIDGERFALTQKECLLLKLLAEHSGQVVSRDEILDKVWGLNSFPTPRTVDNFIARLRRRFEVEPAEPRYIHTLRGVGYRFTPQGGSEEGRE